jgi:hypothetical protein
MFKKIALMSVVAISSQVYAAGCDVPQNQFSWTHNGGYQGGMDLCPDNANCIVQWNGYGWWTNFHANPKGYFYEAGQTYDPRNVTVDSKGLKLTLQKSYLGAPPPNDKPDWSAAEAVLVSKGGNASNDGTPVNIGYGHYLFTYELPVPTAQMDPSTVFGAFTYYRQNIGGKDQGASNNKNNLKELDMVEHSTWGWDGVGDCPFKGQDLDPYGCTGSVQYGAQPWGQPNNLKRESFLTPDIKQNEKVFTAYMYWKDAHQPVVYKLFRGKVDMNTAQSQPGTAAPDFTMTNTEYVPSLKDQDKGGADACVRLHFNFYRAINSSRWVGDHVNIIPKSDEPISVYITNFEYLPNN